MSTRGAVLLPSIGSYIPRLYTAVLSAIKFKLTLLVSGLDFFVFRQLRSSIEAILVHLFPTYGQNSL